MNTPKPINPFLILCASGMLVLSACGGGAVSVSTAPPPATPAVITVVVVATAAPVAATSVALPSVTPQAPNTPAPPPTMTAPPPPAPTSTPKPAATATPKPPTPKPPTPTPAPSVNFSISPGAIYKGEQAKLSWQTKNVEDVWLDNASVPPSSDQMVSPNATKEYKLTVKYADGSQKDFAKTLIVKPNEYKADISADNEILNLWFAPAPKKVCTVVRWSVSGKGAGAALVDGSITGGGLNISLKPPAKGLPILFLPNREVCFTATDAVTYKIHAIFADGVTRDDQVKVTIVNEPLVIKITPIIKP
ncbi:MAG TPA: hypothetical protein PL074_10270 [Thermoflexales bacterium]|nr:hypothetical protein [Thermoflexales bacterium]